MNFCCTSVVNPDAADLVRSVTVALEDEIRPLLAEISFGGEIDQLTIVVVAVDSDPRRNSRFAEGHDGVFSVRDLRSGDQFKTVSIAVVVDPATLDDMKTAELRSIILNTACGRLERREVRMTAGFDWNAAARLLKGAAPPELH